MTDKSVRSGLCESCERRPTCTLPRAPLRPVVRCEEFSDSRGGDGRGRVNGKKQSARPVGAAGRAAAGAAQASADMGLCGTCDDVAVCTFPGAGKAVKHCEEYR